MADDLLATFTNPGPAFRGKPFWSWNGALSRDELVRQIYVFKDMGLGGFFMHSRTGLVTEYLGDEWFELTNACADEAAKLGLEAWLYDEDRWPSGTAGGLVTQEPGHRAKYLSLSFVSPSGFAWDDDIVAAFACDRDGLSVRNVRRLSAESTNVAGDTVLVFRVELHGESTFYNGHTYVDTLSRAATDAYLKVTHDRYAARCGGRLGTTIRGIFTDEPHRGAVMCGFSLPNENRLWMTPWTETLFDEYRAAFDEDLVDNLPELFLHVDGRAVSPVKWRYMEVLQRMFLTNFARPMLAWCDAHRMTLTGHVLHEDSLAAQACMQGSLMRYYEHMHWPGIDILGEHNRCWWAAKQLQSVARQLGQTWLLSELYGCTGWQMTFEQHKAVGDWQALFGVNVRCHHLSWYTMAGEAKRDYPASIGFQSAWWPYYKHVEDYFARLGVILSHGRAACDVLVVNPVESLWCQIHGGWANGLTPTDDAAKELDAKYAELFQWLAGAQIDFDYADEEMLSRLAAVGRDVAGRPVLRFGEAAYRTVVVGHATTVRGSTLALLDAFAAAGGRVVFVGQPPACVDAVASDAASSLADRCVSTAWDRDAAVTAAGDDAAAVRVTTPDGGAAADVFAQVRVDDRGDQWVVLLNTDRDRPAHALNVSLVETAGRYGAMNAASGVGDRADVAAEAPTKSTARAVASAPSIRVDASRSSSRVGSTVAEWDLESAARYAVGAVSRSDGRVAWTTDLPAGGSRAFRVGPTAADGLASRPSRVERFRRPLDGPFDYTLSEPNVCVLDTATYAIDGGAERPATEVLKFDRAVRAAFGRRPRAGDMVQPWYRQTFEPTRPTLGRVRLTFAFDADPVPAGPVRLAMETPARFAVTLNGRPIDTSADDGWWVDPAFRNIAVPSDAIKPGANALTLDVAFDEDVNLEAVYLLGDFGVRLNGCRATLTRLPDRLMPADLTGQGLPFYGAAVRYVLPVGPAGGASLALDLTEMEAACAVVRHDHGRRVLAWQPKVLDVSDAVRDGAVELEVVLTRRNTFGPLHQVPLRTPHYGPENFVTTGERWSDAYVLYPAGLLKPPVLLHD